MDLSDEHGAKAAISYLMKQLKPALNSDKETLRNHNENVSKALEEITKLAAEKASYVKEAKEASSKANTMAELLAKPLDDEVLNNLGQLGVKTDVLKTYTRPVTPTTPVVPPTTPNPAVPDTTVVPGNSTSITDPNMMAIKLELEALRKKNEETSNMLEKAKAEAEFVKRADVLKEMLRSGLEIPGVGTCKAKDDTIDFVVQTFFKDVLQNLKETTLTAETRSILGYNTNTLYVDSNNSSLKTIVENWAKEPYGKVYFEPIKTSSGGANPSIASVRNQMVSDPNHKKPGDTVAVSADTYDIKRVMRMHTDSKGEVDPVRLQMEIVAHKNAGNRDVVDMLYAIQSDANESLAKGKPLVFTLG